MELRDYQSRAVVQTIASIDARPILVAPTGSGKTVMGTEVVRRLNVPTIWLAHRKELITQAMRQLESFGIRCGIIMAGFPESKSALVQVASVQTLVRREIPAAELLVIDECHHATAESYTSIIERNENTNILGLTATPFRLDGRGLGNLFNKIIVAATPKELCDRGILHAPKVWASKSPDLRGVRVVAGDYQLSALSERQNRPELTADIIDTWKKRCFGKRTVCFAVDVLHSKAIVQAFNDAGVNAEHLDGSTNRDERDLILLRLASGETTIVSNCMVLTEGWDLPALECAIVARPTASLNLHLQMIGRIMRAAVGKDAAIVLDHAGNHHVHGLVTRKIKYSLDDTKVGHDDPLNLKRCQNCGLMYDSHETQCPDCGWQPTPKQRDEIGVHHYGQLSEFDDSEFEYRQEFWNLLEAQRMEFGYQPGWSWFRFKDRFGDEPIIINVDGYMELIDPACATLEEKRAYYEHLIGVARSKGFKEGWASFRYKEAFGVWPKGFVSEVKNDRQRIIDRWDN